MKVENPRSKTITINLLPRKKKFVVCTCLIDVGG